MFLFFTKKFEKKVILNLEKRIREYIQKRSQQQIKIENCMMIRKEFSYIFFTFIMQSILSKSRETPSSTVSTNSRLSASVCVMM